MEQIYDLIIIGSGPAGLGAAIYAKRAELKTLVIEREMMSGGQVLTTYEVDNYAGLPGIGGFDLGMKFREHADKLGVEFAKDTVLKIETADLADENEVLEAAEAGADGILLVTPYYNKGTQNGLIKHYTTITEEAKVPAILYNVPSRTGCSLAASTVAYLAKNAEYVTAIKEASGDISHVADIMYACDGAIDLYSGNDDQIVPILSLGGKGVISVLSNVAPKETHDIVALFLEGKIKESRELQLKALPLVHALFSEVNPIPVKAALNLMGKEVGPLRLPLTEMEVAHQEVLVEEMKKFGIKLV